MFLEFVCNKRTIMMMMMMMFIRKLVLWTGFRQSPRSSTGFLDYCFAYLRITRQFRGSA